MWLRLTPLTSSGQRPLKTAKVLTGGFDYRCERSHYQSLRIAHPGHHRSQSDDVDQHDCPVVPEQTNDEPAEDTYEEQV